MGTVRVWTNLDSNAADESFGIDNVVVRALRKECPKCGHDNRGGRTCCGQGGSWQGKCGRPGSATSTHTWAEGMKACAKRTAGGNKMRTVMGMRLEANYSQLQTLTDPSVSATTPDTNTI